MIRIADFVASDEVRALHLRLFHDAGGAYLRSGAFGIAVSRETEQRISNVSGRRIRRILEAVAPFPESDVAAAWSHFMALAAGTHIWPDANHRTALLVFDLVLFRAIGRQVVLDPFTAQTMIRASKALRDGDRRARPGRARYYTVAELADSNHPYRRLYAGYESRLVVSRNAD